MRDSHRIVLTAAALAAASLGVAAALGTAWRLAGGDGHAHPRRALRAAHGASAAEAQASPANAAGPAMPVRPPTGAGSGGPAGERGGEALPRAESPAPGESAREPVWRGVDPPRLELDPLAAGTGPALAIAGFDPLGPRELLLWRLRNGRSAVMARGASARDGSLAFPVLVAPDGGGELIVSGVGEGPDAPGASPARALGARRPQAPRARPLGERGGEHELRIVPSEAAGSVLLADANGAEFARFAVPRALGAPGRSFDVSVALPRGHNRLLLAHELPDGRRSPWRAVGLGHTRPWEEEE